MTMTELKDIKDGEMTMTALKDILEVSNVAFESSDFKSIDQVAYMIDFLGIDFREPSSWFDIIGISLIQRERADQKLLIQHYNMLHEDLVDYFGSNPTRGRIQSIADDSGRQYRRLLIEVVDLKGAYVNENG